MTSSKSFLSYARKMNDRRQELMAKEGAFSDLAQILLDRGVRIALGSDISGGHHVGVYTQAGRAVQLSKLKQFYEPVGNRKLSFPEAFFMATRQGGALFGKVGAFEPGYAFDALIIDGLHDEARALTPEQAVERFCYTGTKDRIIARFFDGFQI